VVPRFLFSRNLSLFAAVAAVLLLSTPAQAQWSAPGNTAIADENSEHVVVRNDTGSIALRRQPGPPGDFSVALVTRSPTQ